MQGKTNARDCWVGSSRFGWVGEEYSRRVGGDVMKEEFSHSFANDADGGTRPGPSTTLATSKW